MQDRIARILNEQMKILFRGEALAVPSRHISASDVYELRRLDIELLEAYLPSLDEAARKRARRTLRLLKSQLAGIRYPELMH